MSPGAESRSVRRFGASVVLGAERARVFRLKGEGTRLQESVEELMADWRREIPTLETDRLASIELALHFASSVEIFRQRVLEPFELCASEYAALCALRRAGSPHRLNASVLAARVGLSSGGATKMLKKLEGAGFVVRRPDPEDGRGSLVELTRRGLELQSRVLNAFVAAAENRLGGVEVDERARLDEAIVQWAEILER